MTLTELEVLASEKLAKNDEETRADFLGLLNAGLLMAIIDNLSGSQRELDDAIKIGVTIKIGVRSIIKKARFVLQPMPRPLRL